MVCSWQHAALGLGITPHRPLRPGVERRAVKASSPVDERLLLMLDPSTSKEALLGSLRAGHNWHGKVKRGLKTLRAPEYQVGVYVCVWLALHTPASARLRQPVPDCVRAVQAIAGGCTARGRKDHHCTCQGGTATATAATATSRSGSLEEARVWTLEVHEEAIGWAVASFTLPSSPCLPLPPTQSLRYHSSVWNASYNSTTT